MSERSHAIEAKRDFAGALDALTGDGTRLVPGLTEDLSHAVAAELEVWRSRWPEVPAERRRFVAEALAQAAERDAHLDFSSLFEAMLDDADAAVRALAVDSLWEVSRPRLMDRFTRMLDRDPSAEVRERAAVALGPYVEGSELGSIARDRVEAAMISLLRTFENDDEVIAVRRRALESLGYADREEAIELIRRAISSSEVALQAGALRAMGRSADVERWRIDVEDSLTSEVAEIRFEAAHAAGALSLESALGRLARLLAEPDTEVRLETIWALGEIGSDKAKRLLEQAREHAQSETEAEAVEDALATVALGGGDIDFWAGQQVDFSRSS